MATNDFTDFKLKQNSYAAFDALSLKELLQNRLKEGGVFTDQSFEGSNLSSILDVISYSYHLLLFYLNQTSSETMFSDASVYENINRIVKLIDYKPKGYQTGLLSFEASASIGLPPNSYTLPRYSFFNINGIIYSFINDATFIKNERGEEVLSNFSNNNLLRQGQYFEYPLQSALGEEFETVVLNLKDPNTNEVLNVDSDSINVYVRNANTGSIEEYTKTSNIFIEQPNSKKYEQRINENSLYEIKFGNGVFASKLNQGDAIIIYYIQSDGAAGKISEGALNGKNLNIFNSALFNVIKNTIYSDNVNLIDNVNSRFLSFSNLLDSTDAIEKEGVESIKNNASKSLQIQNRLVTESDFNTFIQSNYSSILKSFKIVNNKSYVNEYMQYFYDIGLNRPNKDSRLLFNQVNFSSSNQSNNIYLFLVSKLRNVDENNKLSFLSNTQKRSIVDSMQSTKLLNCNIVPQDPVYVSVSLGVRANEDTITPDINQQSFLVIKRDNISTSSAETIKEQVNNIFINYFDNTELGSTISLDTIKSEILDISGVRNVITRRVIGDESYEIPNISLLVYNPVYPENDINTFSENIQLPFFKFAFLENKTILNNILVENV